MKQHINNIVEESAVKDWLRWSMRVDGPLFFKVPSPISSPIDHKDPKYRVRGDLLIFVQELIICKSSQRAAYFLHSLLVLLHPSWVSGSAQPKKMDIQKDWWC